MSAKATDDDGPLLPCAHPTGTADAAATRRLVWLCSLANFVNAADRVLMPICIIELAREFRYSLHEQAFILSAFPAGYISSQIVGSCAGAQLGSRHLLPLVVLMWSVSTLATPLVAAHYHLLLATRVALGLGEGLGLPTIYTLFAEHVPAPHRSTAFAYLTASAGVGQALAAVFVPHAPWRASFVAFGALGLLWCVAWTRQAFVGGQPVNGTLERSGRLRHWQQYLTRSPLLAIYLAHFAMNWMSYTVMHWLPTYLARTLHANEHHLSLAAAPYVANSVCAVRESRCHPL